MKTQEECEWILRELVKSAVERFEETPTLSLRLDDYHRICAQIGICELMETVPAELSQELRNDVRKAYIKAISTCSIRGLPY